VIANRPILPDLTTLTAGDIKGVRLGLGFTQEYFARMIPVSVQTVRAWENDRRTPGPVATARLNELKIYTDEKTAAKRAALKRVINANNEK